MVNKAIGFAGGIASVIRIAVILSAVVATFVSLKITVADLKVSVEKSEQHAKEARDTIRAEGTVLSRTNREDIIRIQSDLRYIVEGVNRIEQKIGP